jgi:hypothetical protein
VYAYAKNKVYIHPIRKHNCIWKRIVFSSRQADRRAFHLVSSHAWPRGIRDSLLRHRITTWPHSFACMWFNVKNPETRILAPVGVVNPLRSAATRTMRYSHAVSMQSSTNHRGKCSKPRDIRVSIFPPIVAGISALAIAEKSRCSASALFFEPVN